MADTPKTPDKSQSHLQFANSRKIAERVWVEGTLKLETPARFGGGQADDLLDMPLLLDALENRALLTGASIAGALRNYVRAREVGDGCKESQISLCTELFGRSQGDAEGAHSILVTHDALSEMPSRPQTELRDGVAIDPRTRTAEDGKKFDIELLSASTQFKLRFEVFLPADEETKRTRLQALAIALQGLERGEIGLGARKRRGFGQCRITGDWTVVRYSIQGQPADLVAWLKRDRSTAKTGRDISALLGLQKQDSALDQRRRFTLRATFALEGSMLIRSGSGDVNGPDAVHLHSRRGNGYVPVLSGTSLAGALRARALRIANTIDNGTPVLAPDGKTRVSKAKKLTYDLFGPRMQEQGFAPAASRLIVHETEVRKSAEPELVQSRVKIDRFTGGAFPTGLFSEQPAFSTDQTEIDVRMELMGAQEGEIGLLLLLLKDLWTGDLALGGESSVGRGRLRGKQATITYDDKTWTLTDQAGKMALGEGDRQLSELEGFVTALSDKIKEQ